MIRDMRRSRTGVLILMYHEVLPDKVENHDLLERIHHSYVVRESEFRSQMRLLARRKTRAISLQELLDYSWASNRTISCKRVVITFDDGYEGNYRYAFPILKQYGLKATFFVTVGSIGTPLMMTWQQLEQLANEGMAIESHTFTHPFLRQLGNVAVRNELEKSRNILEKNLRRPVHFISLPHGSYGKDYRRIALEVGYRGGCCSEAGLNDETVDEFFWRRMKVSRNLRLDRFDRLIQLDQQQVRHLWLMDRAKSIAKLCLGATTYKRLYDFSVLLQKLTH